MSAAAQGPGPGREFLTRFLVALAAVLWVLAAIRQVAAL